MSSREEGGGELSEGYSLLWSAPAAALRLRLLVPWAAGLAGTSLLLDRCAATPLLWPALAVIWAAAVFGLAWVSVWETSAERPPLARHCSLSGRAAGCALLGQLCWACAGGLALTVGALGTLWGLIPGVGSALANAWNFSVGIVAYSVASVLALLAFGVFPLLVPFAACEPRHAITAVTACSSYARRRPLFCSIRVLVVSLSSSLALVPFALASFSSAGLVLASRRLVRDGELPGIGDLAAELLAGMPAVGEVAGDLLSLAAPQSLGPEARFLPWWLAAFAVVSLQVGWTRIYLILRRDLDGVPTDARGFARNERE